MLPCGGDSVHGCSPKCSHLLPHMMKVLVTEGLCGLGSRGDQGQIVEGKPLGWPPTGAGATLPVFKTLNENIEYYLQGNDSE